MEHDMIQRAKDKVESINNKQKKITKGTNVNIEKPGGKEECRKYVLEIGNLNINNKEKKSGSRNEKILLVEKKRNN
jgi:hypothetical protein